jgi:hypothetical protein
MTPPVYGPGLADDACGGTDAQHVRGGWTELPDVSSLPQPHAGCGAQEPMREQRGRLAT